jgi:hypothetical protein
LKAFTLLYDLSLFYRNGARFANLYTAFTAQTLFRVDRLRLFVLELEHLDGAHFNALSAADAFVLVDTRGEHVQNLLS